MKVLLALTAVFFVLLNRSVSIGAHWPSRPGGLHKPPADATNDDSLIPAIAGDLFTAIFSPNELPAVCAQPITNAQGCVSAYNTSTLIIVAYAGEGIRNAVKVRKGDLHITYADLLREQFVENINRCRTLNSSYQRLKCYESKISYLIRIVAASNHSRVSISRAKIKKVLKNLENNLARESERLQECLAQFSESTTSTTPETQTSSETTLTTAVTSSDPQTSLETTVTTGVTSSDPQTSSETTVTTGVTSSESQTSSETTVTSGLFLR